MVVAPLRGTKSLRCRGVEESLSDLGKAAVLSKLWKGHVGCYTIITGAALGTVEKS